MSLRLSSGKSRTKAMRATVHADEPLSAEPTMSSRPLLVEVDALDSPAPADEPMATIVPATKKAAVTRAATRPTRVSLRVVINSSFVEVGETTSSSNGAEKRDPREDSTPASSNVTTKLDGACRWGIKLAVELRLPV